MYSNTQKYAAEVFGTFVLVFFGCGTAMVTGASVVPTALAFGLSILVAAYTIGPISGAHLNPAVSFGMFFDGRMSISEAIGYTVSQIIGAFVASLCHVVLVLCGAIQVYDDGEYVNATIGEVSFGANGFGSLNFLGALLTEIILTFVFVLVILCVTQSEDEGTSKHAGLFIGAALTFVHLIGIGLTGTSVNPARSIAPAVFAAGATDGHSLLQLWVFIVGPLAGAFLAAFMNTALIKKKN
ncbi:MAG: aquaporin [Ruminococcus sp.]|nr:aquaporin [Ruminococcus sp.]